MSLNIPDLDDNTYADIVEDARKRIPVYAEQWTDHNASDPGVTLLELIAWLAEAYTYQLNRVTDAHRLKYLSLLGEEPRPPRPATVDLVVNLPESTGSARFKPPAKLVATDDTDRTYGFETTEWAWLTAARLVRVVTDGDRGRIDHTTANETPGMHFAAFDEPATEGSAFYLGFEGNPFLGNKKLALTVRLHETDLPAPATHGERSDAWTEPEEFSSSVEVEWQHCRQYAHWQRDRGKDSVWKPVPVVEEETDERVGQFYRSGRIVLEEPEKWVRGGGQLFSEDETYRWLRCVLKTDGYEITPRLDSIAVNVVPAEHRWMVQREDDPEPLVNAAGETTSTGLPDQTFRFASPFGSEARPGEERETTLLVDDGHEPTVLVDGDTWNRVGDFDTSGPHDEDYVLDPARGEVRFGDGSRGKLPPEGAEIATSRYVLGGGTEGNLSPATTWSFQDSLPRESTGREDCDFRNQQAQWMTSDLRRLTATQPEPGTGGTDGESIDEVFDRLAEDRLVPYRAVSLADYEYLATHTPGLRFGRAFALLVTNEPVEKPRRDPDAWDCRHVSNSHTGLEAPDSGEREQDREWNDDRRRRLGEWREGPRQRLGTQRVRRQRVLGAQAGREQQVVEIRPGDGTTGDDTRPNSEGQSDEETDTVEHCEPHHEVWVVVVPHSRSSRPTPSREFVETVQRHLDSHRLLTDRVVAKQPTYVGVGVDVEVRLEAEFDADAQREAVEAALDTFLHPLEGFGGDGWPFGRTLYRSELYEEIESVPGVDCVTQLGIRPRGHEGFDSDGNVLIAETALLSPDDHTVTVQLDTRGAECGRGV